MPRAGDYHLANPVWRQTRLAILDRDGWRCQIRSPVCTQAATCVDHIVSRADGGPILDPHNLRAACKQCNGYRAAERVNSRSRSLPFRL